MIKFAPIMIGQQEQLSWSPFGLSKLAAWGITQWKNILQWHKCLGGESNVMEDVHLDNLGGKLNYEDREDKQSRLCRVPAVGLGHGSCVLVSR